MTSPLDAVPGLAVLTSLLDGVPHVMFCIKDAHGVYLDVNQAFADRAGVASPAEVVGRTAGELFPTELAASYEAQDADVIAGKPLRNELELILRPDGSVGWYVTTKVPLPADSPVRGLASVSVDLRAAGDSSPHAGVAVAVAVARARCTESLTVDELARVSGMTVTQLERTMKRTLGMTAKQLVVRCRVEVALEMLHDSTLSIAEVSARAGYYDQSAFTRQFRRVVGVTPGAYRSARVPVASGGSR
jgi:PAS domain S-box-containing protein